jgi:hypothetical protein
VRGCVAFTRRRATFASEPGADKMVARKKPLQIFVGLSYIVHGSSSIEIDQAAFRIERMERLERLELLERLRWFQ